MYSKEHGNFKIVVSSPLAVHPEVALLVRYLTVLLICIFLMISDVKHPLYTFKPFVLSSSEKMSFAHF
jgi:hypothetical protein